MKPTIQQQAVIDHLISPTLSITLCKAVAGAGKTSLLTALADQLPHTHGLYLAYTSSIASEASRKFPSTVECRTTHSLAYQATVKPLKLSIGFFNAKSITERMPYDEKLVFIDVFKEFCLSKFISFSEFVEYKDYPDLYTKLGNKYLDLMHTGKIDCTHEFYLKLFHIMLALGDVTYPPFDFIAIDEAGDLNEVTLEVFKLLPSIRKIAVGDPGQNIFAFNHTINCFELLKDEGTVLPLTQSFRVSPHIATRIEGFMQDYLDPDAVFKGTPQSDDVIRTRGYVTRTNGALIARMIELNELGTPYGLVRQPKEIFKLPLILIGLKHKGFIPNPEWKHLQEDVDRWYTDSFLRTKYKSPVSYIYSIYTEDPAIQQAARLVMQYGKPAIMSAFNEAKKHMSKKQDYTLATAHSCKGLQFDEVTIADDLNDSTGKAILSFTERGDGKPSFSEREVFNLYYVACSRVSKSLLNARHLKD